MINGRPAAFKAILICFLALAPLPPGRPGVWGSHPGEGETQQNKNKFWFEAEGCTVVAYRRPGDLRENILVKNCCGAFRPGLRDGSISDTSAQSFVCGFAASKFWLHVSPVSSVPEARPKGSAAVFR